MRAALGRFGSLTVLVFVVVIVAGAAATEPVRSGAVLGLPGNSFVCLEFDTELTTLNLTGGPFPMPLASDPGNALGDSVEGYGFVDSTVTITLSSQRPVSPGPQSLGQAIAFPGGGVASKAQAKALLGGGTGQCPQEVDPLDYEGQDFFVDSFFDVFYDITVTDVDPRPGRDYAGLPDGASLSYNDNGPAGMGSFYVVTFDVATPNYGLVPPPEADPYIGHFDIEIPLGGDINGNGEDDKIKFTLATHSAGDANRNFIIAPNGDVIEEFDSAAFLEGLVVDLSTDPPFLIGAQLPSGGPDPAAFGGPTTARSTLNTPITQNAVPSLATGAGYLLIGLMLTATAFWIYRRRSRTA